MLTCPCDLDNLVLHFYKVNLEFTRVYIIFIFLVLALKALGGSSGYPQYNLFFSTEKKDKQPSDTFGHFNSRKIAVYCSIHEVLIM